jgi:hypothetical protein
MRSRQDRVVATLERAGSRLIRVALHAGLAVRAFALLEKTGRRAALRSSPDTLAHRRDQPVIGAGGRRT